MIKENNHKPEGRLIKLLKVLLGIIGFCFLPINILLMFPNEWYLVRDTFIFNPIFAFLFYNLITK